MGHESVCLEKLADLVLHYTSHSNSPWVVLFINLMRLTVYFVTFTGPFVGSLIINPGGFASFLLTAIFLTLSGAIFFLHVNPKKERVAPKSGLPHAAAPPEERKSSLTDPSIGKHEAKIHKRSN